MEKKISYVNGIVENAVKERLFSEFGVTVSSLDIDSMEYDKSSKDYNKLLKVTKNITSRKVKSKAIIEIANDSIGLVEKFGEIITDAVLSSIKRKN